MASLQAELSRAVLRRDVQLGRNPTYYTGGMPRLTIHVDREGGRVWRVTAVFTTLDKLRHVLCTLHLPYVTHYATLEKQLEAVQRVLARDDVTFEEREEQKVAPVFRKIIREDDTPAPLPQTRSRILSRINARSGVRSEDV